MRQSLDQNQHIENWERVFNDLPASVKSCRHELGYYVTNRVCDNEFDCSGCVIHNNVKRLEASRRAHGWVEKNPEVEFYGLSFPIDRLYHRGHTWVRKEADDYYSIGLDDFGARLLGKPDSVILPDLGTKIVVNEPAWFVQRNDIEVFLRSPITGEVTETANNTDGWCIKVKTNGNGLLTEHLLRGNEIKRWILKELERLQAALSDQELGVSFADGGVLLEELPVSHPQADWSRVYREIFLKA